MRSHLVGTSTEVMRPAISSVGAAFAGMVLFVLVAARAGVDHDQSGSMADALVLILSTTYKYACAAPVHIRFCG